MGNAPARLLRRGSPHNDVGPHTAVTIAPTFLSQLESFLGFGSNPEVSVAATGVLSSLLVYSLPQLLIRSVTSFSLCTNHYAVYPFPRGGQAPLLRAYRAPCV